VVEVRLPFLPPLWPDSLFGHLVATAVPGVEEWRDGAYRRTVRLARGPAVVELRPGADHVVARLQLSHPDDEPDAVERCRRVLDLDADPAVVDAALARDALLRPLVAAAPGRRIPGTVDGGELALRIVLGQQVSTAAARTHAARLVAALGEPVDDHGGGLTHLFPTPAAVAGVDPTTLAMPASRRRTLVGVAEAVADGPLDLDRLRRLPGVGPWTTSTLAMRALGDPDVFLAGDLGVRAAATRLGLPTTPRALEAHAERWRPWRSYAVQHLWGTSAHPINVMPSG
jgi:AraC family transcriptional regulator of adaptative response / DNA-3-methyladenine glycosylase II